VAELPTRKKIRLYVRQKEPRPGSEESAQEIDMGHEAERSVLGVLAVADGKTL